MQFSNAFVLFSFLTAVAVATPIETAIPSAASAAIDGVKPSAASAAIDGFQPEAGVAEVAGIDDKCFWECMSQCNDLPNFGGGVRICELPCSINCVGGRPKWTTSKLDLDGFVQNRNGRLECFGNFGS